MENDRRSLQRERHHFSIVSLSGANPVQLNELQIQISDASGSHPLVCSMFAALEGLFMKNDIV